MFKTSAEVNANEVNRFIDFPGRTRRVAVINTLLISVGAKDTRQSKRAARSAAPNLFHQIGVVSDMLGADKRNSSGDINSLQLMVDVISGSGAVMTYTSLTDNRTGDTVLRVE